MHAFIIVAGLIVAVFGGQFKYDGYKVYRLQPTKKEQLDLLGELSNNPHMDFWSLSRRLGEPVDVMVDPDAQDDITKLLEKTGIEYDILIDNVERIVQQEKLYQRSAPQKPSGTISFTKFHRHDEINAYLDELSQKHSNIVKVESIGKSYEGRDLRIIRISTGSIANKPILYIEAAIHAREWIAPPVALYAINQLVENASNAALLEKVDWHILPVLNPDGYEYSHTEDRFWRKTRSPNNFSYGTDGNRNFDFHWGEVGASNNEWSDIYRGSKPFSEVETQALRDDILKYKKNIKLHLSLHSQGNKFLYPWAYTSELPEDAEELQTLGELAANAIHKVNGTNYTTGSHSDILYYIGGGVSDWIKAIAGINITYIVELPKGGSGFDPPPSDILPVVTETWEGIKAFHQYIQERFG